MSRGSGRALQSSAIWLRLPIGALEEHSAPIAITELTSIETGPGHRPNSCPPDSSRAARPIPVVEVQRSAPARTDARIRPSAQVRHRSRTKVACGHLRVQLHRGPLMKYFECVKKSNNYRSLLQFSLTERASMFFNMVYVPVFSSIAPDSLLHILKQSTHPFKLLRYNLVFPRFIRNTY